MCSILPKLPGAPDPLPKGWGANDWDVSRWRVDAIAAMRGAVRVARGA